MLEEIENSYLSNINSNHSVMPFQRETDASNIDEFINSVLVSSDDCPNEDSGMYKMSFLETETPNHLKPLGFRKSSSKSQVEVPREQVNGSCQGFLSFCFSSLQDHQTALVATYLDAYLVLAD